MNPILYSTASNSIKLYSLRENDSESASIYLTKFSKLIRLVLNILVLSGLLEKEIETYDFYIEVEIVRF
ncbi:MAG: histidine kinase [Cytophagaceae bacterium]|nr:histidine kinase [Cytophagaceae bacterium]